MKPSFGYGELSPEQEVLDFGCGAGVFLPSFCWCTQSVVALDLLPQYAKRLVESWAWTWNLPTASTR